MSVPWFSSEASTLAGLSIGLSQKVMMVVLMMNQLVVGLTVQLLQLRKVMVANCKKTSSHQVPSTFIFVTKFLEICWKPKILDYHPIVNAIASRYIGEDHENLLYF